jgi:VWFA-related protein
MARSESGSIWRNLSKMMGVVRATRWLCIVGFALCLSGAALTAQDKSTSATAETAQDVSMTTLHVYESLLQVPVLVLRPNGDRIKTPISDAQFSVSLDSGPWFRATHVRPEGDDPISLSILLDVSGDGKMLMSKMADAIAALAPQSLRPQDHVSVYALDCSLISGANDFPADSAALKQAVDGVWAGRNGKKHVHGAADSDCNQKEYLWDTLAKLTESLHQLPGRRVILVVSDGNDHGSTHPWNQLIEEAQGASVSIFGLEYRPEQVGTDATSTADPIQTRGDVDFSNGTAPPVELDKDSPFRKVCELTGGTAKLATPRTLKARLKGLTAMVRERYIVEFPRPLNGKPGWHGITVKIDRGNYFIRSAGITFPLMNPAVLADPMTVPSNPSLAPSLGSGSQLHSSQ